MAAASTVARATTPTGAVAPAPAAHLSTSTAAEAPQAAVHSGSSKDSQNSGSDVSSNPLLMRNADRGELPHFSALTAPVVLEGCRALFDSLHSDFRLWEQTASGALEAQQVSWTLFESLQALNDRLSFGWGAVTHLAAVRDRADLRAAVQELEPRALELSLRLGQSATVAAFLRALRTAGGLDAAQKKILDDALLSMRLAGVELDEARRSRFNALSQRLSSLSTTFSHRVLDATKSFGLTIVDPEVMRGLPDAARTLYARHAATTEPKMEGATPEAGPWRVGLSAAHLMPFLKYCASREHRRLLSKAYTSRASVLDGFDNAPVLAEILALRHELAHMLGFSSYAEQSLASKMVRNVSQVETFLRDLHEVAHPRAVRELDAMQQFAWEHDFPRSETLQSWDLAYWAERQQQALYSFDSEQLRPYLPFPRVLQGLWTLVEELYGVRVVERDPSQVGPGRAVDTWHESVKYFDVLSPEGKVVAGFFVDAYARPEEKRGGAWMGECVGGGDVTLPDGTRTHRLPVAYLICNQQPPAGPDRPSLMSFDELTTLLHEFGHVSQHVLTRVSYTAAAGIRGVEWDAVELASQFLENFAYERSVLDRFAQHVDTGKALPGEMFDALVAAKNYRAAYHLLRQLHFSALDFALHAGMPLENGQHLSLPLDGVVRSADADGSASVEVDADALSRLSAAVRSMEAQVASRFSLLPFDPQSHTLNSFQHIFAGGYAAGYFSYKWAEVMSADAFQAFLDAAAANTDADARAAQWKELGLRFRETVLALGGSKPAADVFREFRGREPSVTPLLQQAGLVDDAKPAEASSQL